MSASAANATLITFATWTELSGGGNLFEYKNSGAQSGASSQFETGTGTTGTPVPISFLFENIEGTLPLPLQSAVNAHMTITAPAIGQASSVLIPGVGYYTTQGIGGTITITADTPMAGLDNNPADNILLQITFVSSGGLQGFRGGQTASMLADTAVGDTITFSSDYLTFGTPVADEISMSFTTVSPCFTRNTAANCSPAVTTNIGNYLTQFTAHGSGSFAAAPQPEGFVPEPTSMILIGSSILGLGAMLRRKNSKS